MRDCRALWPYALALALFALCAFSPKIFNDADTFSHIATGAWILAHHAVPHTDPFSFSMAGKPWIAHEWGAEVLMALVFRVGGFVGLALLTACAVSFSGFVTARAVARHLHGSWLIIFTLITPLLMAPHLLVRPHVLVLPLLVIWADALTRKREKAPALSYAFVFWLWANMHASFALGLALLPPFALEAIFEAPPEHRKALLWDWGLLALACLFATLATPFGFAGIMFPLHLLFMAHVSNISEWVPANFSQLQGLEMVLLGWIAIASLYPLRIKPLRLGILLVLLHMSLQHVRHEIVFAIVGPMILACSFQRVEPSEPRRSFAAATMGAMFLLASLRCAFPAPFIPNYASFCAVLAIISEKIRDKPVLNGYNWGGYLIFSGIKPYVDARADLYGDAFLDTYAKIANGDEPAVKTVLREKKIDWALFSPEQGIVAVLNHSPGWRRIYNDPNIVVYTRVLP